MEYLAIYIIIACLVYCRFRLAENGRVTEVVTIITIIVSALWPIYWMLEVYGIINSRVKKNTKRGIIHKTFRRNKTITK